MQRMGGINDFVLSNDDNFIISVGQDKRIMIWERTKNDPIYHTLLDDEQDEGLAIAM
jgi:hypothetical protein